MTPFEFFPKQFPGGPGCYLMKDCRGKVIYVGKARNLRRRLSSYFQRCPKDQKVIELVKNIASIEVILVRNETESLILENNLIKRHRPRYNIFMNSDYGSWQYIVLTDETYPRLAPFKHNRPNNDLARTKAVGISLRFGPYTSWQFRQKLMEFTSSYFQLRTCEPMPRKVCLQYHIHICCGICEDKITPSKYALLVNEAIEFLSHSQGEIINQMKNQMVESAERLEFEHAQLLKERIGILEKILEPQCVEREINYDQDFIYFQDDNALILEIKHGHVQGITFYQVDNGHNPQSSRQEFILDHYTQNKPDEIVVTGLDKPDEVAAALYTWSGHPVKIRQPVTADDWDLIKLCELNYTYRVQNQLTTLSASSS
ncbi:MAG: GIY-YIG nuclease family protein [Omnitrophica WOR_2 bacterium]